MSDQALARRELRHATAAAATQLLNVAALAQIANDPELTKHAEQWASELSKRVEGLDASLPRK